jgi:cytochrome c oxidase subunit IV
LPESATTYQQSHMIDRFWYVIGYVFALNSEAFRVAATLPQGVQLALLIVLFAGCRAALASAPFSFSTKSSRCDFS